MRIKYIHNDAMNYESLKLHHNIENNYYPERESRLTPRQGFVSKALLSRVGANYFLAITNEVECGEIQSQGRLESESEPRLDRWNVI